MVCKVLLIRALNFSLLLLHNGCLTFPTSNTLTVQCILFSAAPTTHYPLCAFVLFLSVTVFELLDFEKDAFLCRNKRQCDHQMRHLLNYSLWIVMLCRLRSQYTSLYPPTVSYCLPKSVQILGSFFSDCFV